MSGYRMIACLCIGKLGDLDCLTYDCPTAILNDEKIILPIFNVDSEFITDIREKMHNCVDDVCNDFIINGVLGDEN